jgi:phosphoglycerate dehydrogenase-like enzyme
MPVGRVLLTDNIFASLDEFQTELEPLGLKLEQARASDEATLVDMVRNAVAMIVVYAKITDPVIAAAAAAGCRVISRCGIGYDNIDIESATRHGVQVTYVPDYCLDEVADHTIAMLLAFARGLVPSVLATRSGEWKAPREAMHRMHGRTLALVGVGRIGRRVAARAQALGLAVIAYDPYVREWDLPGVSRASSLEAALEAADFVSLHAPLTTENHHLVSDKTLAMMKRKPLLINTARGGLVDLDAVSAALSGGGLAGVALDVFEVEPLRADHPLRTHPRALITPHAAYYSIESEAELKHRAAEEVARAFRGEAPRCPVNQLEARHVG